MNSTIFSMIVIPARLDSGRLPNKPLLEVGGKSLLMMTYGQAVRTSAKLVMVATPDDEIVDHCKEYDISFIKTRRSHLSGTSRCFEALESWMSGDNRREMPRVLVNWQCDEPLVDPAWVDVLIRETSTRGSIGTLLEHYGNITLENTLPLEKARAGTVFAAASEKRCFWFSRAALRGGMVHTGVYAFNQTIFGDMKTVAPTRLGCMERLEQLDWIGRGISMFPVFMDHSPLAVNTREDCDELCKMVQNGEAKDD
jgi:3-deoxy-manno-octulosonate cytidylyltransferase (CMP-KDO synthetase)